MGEFCDFKFDGLGTSCNRCGCWKRGTEPPTCPTFITRREPDGSRLPNIKTKRENKIAYRQFLARWDAEVSLSNGEAK